MKLTNIFLSTIILFPLSLSSQTMKGMHDTIGGPQSNGLENMTKAGGHIPEVFSSDFGYSTHPNDDFRKRKDLLEKVLKLSSQVKIITLSHHQCRPDIQEPCTFNTGVANVDYNDKEWEELLKWDSPLNKRWQKQIKPLADFIGKLNEKKITLYLRPYHESNLPLFWWSNIKKPQYSIALWKMLHKHLTNDYKLSNIKWVWSISYHPKHLDNLEKFYPGDEFVDVLGFDIYPPAKDSPPNFENAWNILEKISQKKEKALTEVSRLPASQDLKKHAWLYVVPWGEVMLRKENTIEDIKSFYQKN
jgi:mannan endo-1,4-beta-mannosidase